MTKHEIKADLQDIRYYYTHKAMFDRAEDTGFKNIVVKKAERYGVYMSRASPKLYALFYSLYVEGKTHLATAMDWNVTEGHIKNVSNQLYLYLGKGDNGYDEFVCGGIAFTDEFISAYNSLNGSATDLTSKMNRGNLSSSVQSAKEFDFDTGAAGQGVFDDLLGSVGLTDTTIGYLRAAVNQVGEENVFKFGIFKSTSAISDAYIKELHG